jgi:ankyrin repeat protein
MWKSKRRKVVATTYVSPEEEKKDRARFHLAVKNGRLGEVQEMVSQSLGLVHAADGKGHAPICIAAKHGHLAVVRFLFGTARANANERNYMDPSQAIFTAILRGHLEVVRYFVDVARAGGFDDRAMTVCVHDLLHNAVSCGQTDIARYLVTEEGAYVDEPTMLLELSNVYMAAEKNHIEVVRYLVEEASANPNMCNVHGVTPLYIAIEQGHIEIVRYLVGREAVNVNIANKSGCTPLHFAARFGQLEILRLLLGQATAMADVNKISEGGYTPLHFGVMNGHMEIVRYLAVEAGASDTVHQVNPVSQLYPSIRKRYPYWDDPVSSGTPLHSAILRGNFPMVQYLLSWAGAPVNLFDASLGLSPPLLLALNGTGEFALQIIRCLVLAGAMFVGPQTFHEFAPSPHLIKSALYIYVKERDQLATIKRLKGLLLPSCVCSIVGDYMAPIDWNDVLARLS